MADRRILCMQEEAQQPFKDERMMLPTSSHW